MLDAPSVRRALPPVGVQSTAEQLLQTTTVWLWLKTVVLHGRARCQGPPTSTLLTTRHAGWARLRLGARGMRADGSSLDQGNVMQPHIDQL